MNVDRRAALLLMDLDKHDRIDILARLPDEIRERVMPPLAELSAMGIATGQDWLSQLVPAQADRDQRVQVAAAIDAADTATMQDLLAREPDCIVAAVLACGDWRWAPDYLEGLSSDRRQDLEKKIAIVKTTAKPRPLNRLLEQVAERLGRGTAASPASTSFDAALAAHDATLQRAAWRPAWAR